jgi:ribosomal protein S15P/S13E
MTGSMSKANARQSHKNDRISSYYNQYKLKGTKFIRKISKLKKHVDLYPMDNKAKGTLDRMKNEHPVEYHKAT